MPNTIKDIFPEKSTQMNKPEFPLGIRSPRQFSIRSDSGGVGRRSLPSHSTSPRGPSRSTGSAKRRVSFSLETVTSPRRAPRHLQTKRRASRCLQGGRCSSPETESQNDAADVERQLHYIVPRRSPRITLSDLRPVEASGSPGLRFLRGPSSHSGTPGAKNHAEPRGRER